MIVPLWIPVTNVSNLTNVLSFHQLGWPVVVLKICQRWFTIMLYVQAACFILPPKWAFFRQLLHFSSNMCFASVDPTAPWSPALFISCIWFCASSLFIEDTAYFLKRTVLPILMKTWKKVRWVSRAIPVASSRSSNVYPRPMRRRLPKIISWRSIFVSHRENQSPSQASWINCKKFAYGSRKQLLDRMWNLLFSRSGFFTYIKYHNDCSGFISHISPSES